MRISQTLLIGAVFAAALALAACGNKGNGNNANGNTTANDAQTTSQQAQNTGQQMQNQAGNAAHNAKVGASDTAITAAVKSKLLANSSTSGMDIHVETNHGVVTLSGTVRSDAEKNLAERIARNTDGVTDVTNNLKVQGS